MRSSKVNQANMKEQRIVLDCFAFYPLQYNEVFVYQHKTSIFLYIKVSRILPVLFCIKKYDRRKVLYFQKNTWSWKHEQDLFLVKNVFPKMSSKIFLGKKHTSKKGTKYFIINCF